MRAYLDIYLEIWKYIWISSYLYLKERLWRKPTHQEHFWYVWDLKLTSELNLAFNQLAEWEEYNNDFFIIRDVIMSGCTNSIVNSCSYDYHE